MVGMEGTGCKASYLRVSTLVWVSQGTKCHPPKGGYVILLVCIVCTAYYGTRYQTLPWYLPKAVYKNASYNERYTRYVRLHIRCPGIRQAQLDGCSGVYHAELRGGCPPSLPGETDGRHHPAPVSPPCDLVGAWAPPPPAPPEAANNPHHHPQEAQCTICKCTHYPRYEESSTHPSAASRPQDSPIWNHSLATTVFCMSFPACEPLIFFNWSFSPIIAENQRRDKDDSPSHFPSPLSFLLFNSLSNHWNLLKSRLLSNDSYYEQSLKEWINSGVLKKNLYWVIKTIFHGPERQIEILKQKSKGVFTLIL